MNDQALGIATQIMVMTVIISVMLLFVGIGALIVVHVCVVGRAFRRGFGNSNMIDRHILGSTSMSQDDIDKLPCFDFKARSKGSSPMDCAVCLENFKAGEKCRLLPLCNHSFHAQCVDSWLQRTPACPICRSSADSWNSGLISGDESSHSTNETAIGLSQTRARETGHFNEISMELTQGNLAGIGHLTTDTSIEMRESQEQDTIH